MRRFIILLFLLALPLPVLAQMPSPTVQLNEMKKLSYMVGQWKGSGWMEQAGKRTDFSGTEMIQSKLNGLALLVEGKFNTQVGGKDVTVHETLAVLSYDERSKTFRFRTYLASGITGDQEAKLIDGGWQWGFQFPGGTIRYTIKVNEKNEWFEVGEMSQDGTTWRKFFEMTLQRVK
ncbi:MAG TPA: hypothetical protein VKB86_14130 [Pyrinomonadaceae bacterium]|nr:hypothetical protein [Pyrinomonadaceae bacterium]